MMSIDHIVGLAKEQAAQASRMEKQPMRIPNKVYWGKLSADKKAERLRRIPNIGGYTHPDWERVDNFMVDSSGFGQRGESALTLDQFVDRVVPRRGYAIIEEGQFQVIVGEFVHHKDHADYLKGQDNDNG
jgi:hypothetical protein